MFRFLPLATTLPTIGRGQCRQRCVSQSVGSNERFDAKKSDMQEVSKNIEANGGLCHLVVINHLDRLVRYGL